MSNVTLEGIAKLLEVELKPIKATLAEHTKILNTHSAALDTLLSKKKIKEDEKIVSADRFDRLEHWAQLVGKRLGIKLEL